MTENISAHPSKSTAHQTCSLNRRWGSISDVYGVLQTTWWYPHCSRNTNNAAYRRI